MTPFARALGTAVAALAIVWILTWALVRIFDPSGQCPRGYDLVVFHTSRGNVPACVDD